LNEATRFQLSEWAATSREKTATPARNLRGAAIATTIALMLHAGLVWSQTPADETARTAEKTSAVSSSSSSSLSGRIAEALMYAVSMVGVPYRFGGNNAETGFDCSGFVHHVFGHIVSHNMPRQADGMARVGQPIARSALKPGDLVFYNTLRRPFSHVGIYLGNNQFIHAPSAGKTVEIVEMSDRYWQTRFNGARRWFGDYAPISIPQGVPNLDDDR
jgi:cell wall-associated NlpC family hydrolase